MTPAELWIRYYAVGGDTAELEVEAYALGLLSRKTMSTVSSPRR
jgi:hypothetical protein